MFQIARLKDAAVTIKPQHLDKDPLTAIVAELEELYVDKVIADLGLVVTLYLSLIHISEPTRPY